MYRLLAEYERVFGSLTAREFPLSGGGMFAFKVRAKHLRQVLRNMGTDMEEAAFILVYADGSRQGAHYIGTSGSEAIFMCLLDDPVEGRCAA